MISIFPNPAQNTLSVVFPLTNKTTIKLRSIIGEEIISADIINENSAQLDVSKITSGVYLLEVNNSNGKIVKRIIKE